MANVAGKKTESGIPVVVRKSRGKRKLTDAQVLDIVKRYTEGVKRGALATAYGVAHGTVTAIVNGKTYSWLTGIGGPKLAAA